MEVIYSRLSAPLGTLQPVPAEFRGSLIRGSIYSRVKVILGTIRVRLRHDMCRRDEEQSADERASMLEPPVEKEMKQIERTDLIVNSKEPEI